MAKVERVPASLLRRVSVLLAASALLLALSLLLLVDTTHAWFTKTVTNGGNRIQTVEVFSERQSTPSPERDNAEALSESESDPATDAYESPPESEPPAEGSGFPESGAASSDSGQGSDEPQGDGEGAVTIPDVPDPGGVDSDDAVAGPARAEAVEPSRSANEG